MTDVDCFWREQRLVVECGSWRFHEMRQKLEHEAPQLEAEILELLSVAPGTAGARASGQ